MHRFEASPTNISIVNAPPKTARYERGVTIPLLEDALRRRAWREVEDAWGIVWVKPAKSRTCDLPLQIDNPSIVNKRRVHIVIETAKRLGLPIRMRARQGKWSYYQKLMEA
jgi:hypothetical protein